MQIFHCIELPFCKVLMMDPWNAPAHRYFIAYNAREDFRYVLGLPVIDEFATFSSPIFFTPNPLLGKMYNAGISLAHLRDPDMGMETGWPPLCIGIDKPAPELPPDWEQTLIQRLQSTKFEPPEVNGSVVDLLSASVEGFKLQGGRIGQSTIFATNAPLLPRQLKRVAQMADSPFAIAFSTGNRIASPDDPAPLVINALSEETLRRILVGFVPINSVL